MTYTALRAVNADGGIVATRIDGGDEYLEPGSEAHGRALAGAFGPVAQYIAPVVDSLAEWRESASVTDIQFAIAAVAGELITALEAEAWVARGEIPTIALNAIALLPVELQPVARIRFSGARTIARLDPFVTGPLAAVAGMTDAQLDTFFQEAALL